VSQINRLTWSAHDSTKENNDLDKKYKYCKAEGIKPKLRPKTWKKVVEISCRIQQLKI